jgi:hypothetical protein
MKQVPIICKHEFPGNEFWIYVNISSSDNILFEIKKTLDVLSGFNVTKKELGFLKWCFWVPVIGAHCWIGN